MDNLSFDAEVFRLGRLCPRGHDWNGTGQTLRYKCDGKCPLCRRKYPEGRPKNPDARKEYYRQHSEEIKARVKKWREDNPDRVLDYARKWRENNREHCREAARERYHRNAAAARCRQKRYDQSEKGKATRKSHYKKNREAIAQKQKRYQSSPKGRVTKVAAFHRREARKLNNHSFPYTKQQIDQLKQSFGHCCAYCGTLTSLTLDHFVPVTNKGGPDCLGNLVPACLSCNSSKCDSDAQEWYERQPFYSQKRWQKILKVLGRTAANGQLPLF